MSTIRKCSICDKEITEGYVFDGTDCFCSKECAVECFNGDEGCVEILIDEGEPCDRLNLAQTHYLDKPLINDEGEYNYQYVDGEVKEI